MAEVFQETHWRGMRIEHPGDWELVVASGRDEGPRCTFADRRYQRLDLRWGPIKYVPDLKLLLTKYRQRTKGDGIDLHDAPNLPEPWLGLVRKSPEGRVLHAGRFFPQQRLLAEATIVWPKHRQSETEERILAGFGPLDDQTPAQSWQALGICLLLRRDYDLHVNDCQVGRVRWTFRTKQKGEPVVEVERLAMPQTWLKDSVGDWLADQLPAEYRVLRRDVVHYNGHRGETLLSVARVGRLSRLRRRRQLRMDLAWQCPTENRLYRLGVTRTSRSEDVAAPEPLSVRCCQEAPAV